MQFILIACLVIAVPIVIFKVRDRRFTAAYRAKMKAIDAEFATFEAEQAARRVSMPPVPAASEHDRASLAYEIARREVSSDIWEIKRPWFAMPNSKSHLSVRYGRN